MGSGASTAAQDFAWGELSVKVVAGKGLLAQDVGVFKSTSDPFVKVSLAGEHLGKTDIMKKTLDPEWEQQVLTEYIVGPRMLKQVYADPYVRCAIFDYDLLSASDPMGEIKIPLADLLSGRDVDKWYPVENCPGCSKAKGELRVVASFAGRKALSLGRGSTFDLQGGMICVGMAWDMLPGGRPVDVDTSCVGVSAQGRVLLDETVYFADLVNSNGSIRHSGDEREGDADLTAGGDDEVKASVTS